MLDWCASVPENGAGLALVQFQVSPPSEPPTPPPGKRSSTHTTLFVEPGLFVPPEPGVFVLLLLVTVFTPVASHVARPPKRLNAMPLTVLPSRPTDFAGTSNRTQRPSSGSAPMFFRPSVLLTP